MNKTIKKLIASAILLIVGGGISFYVYLPPLNFQSKEFWSFLTWLLILALIPFVFKGKSKVVKTNANDSKGFYVNVNGIALNFPIIIAVLLPIAIMIIGDISSSTFLRAKAYASIIDVEEKLFEEDMPQTENVTNIALMDTNSAIAIGNRALGSLSNVVSQYQVSEDYTQINYNGAPRKVSTLEYADFFKWLNNRSNGIPGYIMVDPVNNTAEYKSLKTPIYYTDSAYFGKDLMRALRFSYPTKIFGCVSFEINESGEPYYIVSCMSSKVGLFGAKDVTEVIIFNPCDKSSTLYKVSETPAWVDIVYTGHLATQKYNWYGTLSGGYWNSVIGNVGCKETTDDFGYIALEDDVWYFTGVTSVVADESNIGFILTNARTGEYKFYSIVGAEEYSAMAAAEGEVQEKRYKASFPSLINVAGEATYIMVLKDSGGLVKLYALVNVEQYGIVATGSTQAEAMVNYKKLLSNNGIMDKVDVENSQSSVEVEDVRLATVDDMTAIYITDVNGNVYKGFLSNDESLILIRKNDRLKITAGVTENERIFIIEEWQFDTVDEEPIPDTDNQTEAVE